MRIGDAGAHEQAALGDGEILDGAGDAVGIVTDQQRNIWRERQPAALGEFHPLAIDHGGRGIALDDLGVVGGGEQWRRREWCGRDAVALQQLCKLQPERYRLPGHVRLVRR